MSPEKNALTLLEKDGEVRFDVRAKPRAKRSTILGVNEERAALEVSIAAPPADGAANAELIAVLAEALRVPKSSIRIVRGQSSRNKGVAVTGLPANEVRERLARAR